jgi:uncharacterized membrane protein
VFEFLFKYRPLVFERGDLSIAVPWWVVALAVAGIVLAVPLLLQYRATANSERRLDHWILSGLRTLALLVLLFCLLRPVLLISTVVPRRNYVAVVLDHSRSMRVADEDEVARGTRVLELFGADTDEGTSDQAARTPAMDSTGGPQGEDGATTDDPATAADPDLSLAPADAGETGRIRRALEERFRVRFYRFSSEAERVDDADALRFTGERTGLSSALARVQQEMAGLPFSGVVLVTDGADNADRPLAETLLALQAASVPVYTVGLGRERIAPDVEVRRVETPRRVLRGTTLVADVILSHAGLSGRTARLDVEDGGRILGTRELELGVDGESPIQIQFTMEESGPRQLRFRVRPIEGEAVADNNSKVMLVEVWDDRQKVLYFEGSPRPEVAFLRRAVAGDANLQVVTLVRTAEEKFWRGDVDDAEELAGGFPSTREELFTYSGFVLGDVEASFFTHDQLQMIADFVGQRGGGLLVLGGHRALAEGGYADTPLADALPVVLDPGIESELVEVQPQLTPAGRRHPAMRIAGDESTSADRWITLPGLTSVNRVERVKPGAVTLLNGVSAGGDLRIMLAHQRYGRGTTIAFPVQDSWLWQMHADMPLDDETHETLWRQLLRWLVHDVPGRVRLELPDGSTPPAEPVTIRAEVEDERFLRVNGASVAARVTGPDGVPREVPLEWTVEGDGEYEGRFIPDEEGLYEIEAVATLPGPPGDPGITPLAGTGHFRAGAPELEPFSAGRRTELLERIADETGGRFYTLDEIDALPEEIRFTESGDTVLEEQPLWDMPILFLFLGILLSAEWGFRRWRGLA